MEKVLIVGSKGFIGSHLKKYFSENGFSVYGADIINDYRQTNHYFLIDASNANYHRIFETNDFDFCINCSGAASVPDSIKNPLRDYNLNTVNVYKLLDAIRTYSPSCRFINLSSAAVYGNPKKLPIVENSELSPVSPYGLHKKMSEDICKEYYSFFNIQTCSLRIFSAYGEGLRKQLFWDLYQKSKSNRKIILYGTGNESRDFIYIKDLVHAIYLVAIKGSFAGQIINIGNAKEIFIKDCVATFYSCFDKEVSYSFSGEGRKGDPNNWVANIDVLKSLGYKQEFDLKKGLSNFYKWVRSEEKE